MIIKNLTPTKVYTLLTVGLLAAFENAHLTPVRDCPFPAWRLFSGDALSVFLSLQVDTKATDPFAGGGFRIELEHSTQRRPALGLNGRALFLQLLTADELRILLYQQNDIIDRLKPPLPEQIQLYADGPIRAQYLQYFRRQSAFDAVRSWLRYNSEADVVAWADLLSSLVQPLVQRAGIYLSPETRSLGKGCLLTDE